MAAFLSLHAGCRAGTCRFELALAASLLLHALLGVAFVLETPARERRAAGYPAITVRIQPAPATSLETLAPVAEPLFAPPVAPKPRAGAAAGDAGQQPKEMTPLALPQAPDPTYYSVRDLDAYPRPAAPLQLDRFAADAATSLRFSLAIDENGLVKEVASIETLSGARARDEVRAMLAATRFIPGRKDGRAVKSRMLLDVMLGPSPREP